jgi:type IV pilus assembly protein PilE
MPVRPRSSALRPCRHRSCHRQRAFTLIEVMTVCAIAAVLALIGFYAFDGQVRRGKRQDAISALTRLQQAQDSYHYQNGMYAPQLQLLGLPGNSPQDLYALSISETAPGRYSATAAARPGSSQAKDGECSTLSLSVSLAGAEYGPKPRCWNR